MAISWPLAVPLRTLSRTSHISHVTDSGLHGEASDLDSPSELDYLAALRLLILTRKDTALYTSAEHIAAQFQVPMISVFPGIKRAFKSGP